ncbi:hypothetical protein RHMOL_Rhmol06G0253200 [Rhododendron molle]|uniref:Uncharacterized protein n=1 Tax=Rhododendron molle TaxID=49168 RepID=A0ACC0NFZ9_RHOML|nr:hypothetical protein RHMOL_Rhmol06G0253200 [Rhododendron molle]
MDQNKVPVRGDIHVIIVGDPGLGKSQLLQAAATVSPRGIYVCGNATTNAGLTVAVVKDTMTSDYAFEADLDVGVTAAIVGLTRATKTTPCSEARFVQTSKGLFRSLYTFGDSYVDPGNNDFITTPFRSNFPPYGRDFPGKVSTGRFSNGLLFPDLLAYYVGVGKYTRPYLDPRLDLKESPTAISFASATSGYDPDTSLSLNSLVFVLNLSPAQTVNAIQLFDQMENFKQYKERLVKTIGTKKAKRKIEKALFYVNAGSDDFAFTYFQDGKDQENRRTPQQYEQVLLYFVRQFLQRLLDQGARKIAVNGLPPLGCIPVGITLLPATPRNTQAVTRSQRKCLDYVNVISSDFNSMLQEELDDLQSEHPEIKIAYIYFEEPLLDVIQNPDDYG